MQCLHAVLPLSTLLAVTDPPSHCLSVLFCTAPWHHDHRKETTGETGETRPSSAWLLGTFGEVQAHVHIAAAVAEPGANFEPNRESVLVSYVYTLYTMWVCLKMGVPQNGGW